MMAGGDTDVIPRPRSGKARPRPWSPIVLSSVMAVGGAAFAVLTGLDGSPAWRAVRVMAVLAGQGARVAAVDIAESFITAAAGQDRSGICYMAGDGAALPFA